MKPNGYVVYRGPSAIDGAPVVAVLVGFTRRSKNEKTGAALQLHILPDGDAPPSENYWRGGGRGNCTGCPHVGRSCYVNWAQAPDAVWDALRRGNYPLFRPQIHLHLLKSRPLLRLGASGDPAAIPSRILRVLVDAAHTHTGYTHQWRSCDQRIRRTCMASVETPEQARAAWLMGWRTFRARVAGAPLIKGEFVCPASEEAGRRLTCAECRACDGRASGGASPVIVLHGPDNAVGKAMAKRYAETVMLASKRHPLTLV